jgi:hypothetical protein
MQIKTKMRLAQLMLWVGGIMIGWGVHGMIYPNDSEIYKTKAAQYENNWQACEGILRSK